MGRKAQEVSSIDKMLAELFQKELEARGISVRKLAELSGISLGRTSELIRGDRAYYLGDIEEICRVLNLVPWQILKSAQAQLEEESAPALEVIEGGSSAPDVSEPPLPDFSKLAARTVKSRPQWDAAQQDIHAD